MKAREPEQALALVAVAHAIRRGWTNHNLAGCEATVAAIRLGWLRQDKRYGGLGRYKITVAGHRAWDERSLDL